MEINHRGERYAIGQRGDDYALWHTEAGGDPIRTFPRTDEGWRQAWAEFERLERGARPAAPGTPNPHVRAAAITQIVLGLIVLLAGVALLSAPDELDVEEGLATTLAVITLAQGVLEILAGSQALRRVNWGRILGIVIAAVGIVSILMQVTAAAGGLLVALLIMLTVRGYMIWAYLARWGPVERNPRVAEWDPSSRW